MVVPDLGPPPDGRSSQEISILKEHPVMGGKTSYLWKHIKLTTTAQGSLLRSLRDALMEVADPEEMIVKKLNPDQR